MYKFQKCNYLHRSGYFSSSHRFQKYSNKSNNQFFCNHHLHENGRVQTPFKKICQYKQKYKNNKYRDKHQRQVKYVQKKQKYKEKINIPLKYVQKTKVRYIEKQVFLKNTHNDKQNKSDNIIQKAKQNHQLTQKEKINQEIYEQQVQEQLQKLDIFKNSKSQVINKEQDEMNLCNFHYQKTFIRSLSKRKINKIQNQTIQIPELMGVILKVRQVNCKQIKIHTMVDHKDQRIQTYNFKDRFEIRNVNRKEFFSKTQEQREWKLAQSRYPLRVSFVKLRCMICGKMYKCLLSHFVYTAKTCQRCVNCLQFEIKGGQMIQLL